MRLPVGCDACEGLAVGGRGQLCQMGQWRREMCEQDSKALVRTVVEACRAQGWTDREIPRERGIPSRT